MDLEKIKEALSTAQALHAVMMGAKASLIEVEVDASEKIQSARVAMEDEVKSAKDYFDAVVARAKAEFDRVAKECEGGVKEAHSEVMVAEKELKDYQEKIFKDLNIVVDLLGPKPGGSTRL